jgi:tight adherence protein C
MLIRANLRMPGEVFLALWAAAIAIGIASAWLVAMSTRNYALSLPFLLFYGLVPYLFVRRRVRQRQKQIQLELPYALDLLVTCMEAGLGVDAAFATVTEKLEGPVAEAFGFYLRQVGLGRPRRDALFEVGERTGAPDLVRLAAVVAQAEEMGGSLGDVLRTQAEDLRLLRRRRAEEAAQRAPTLMTLPLVVCFMPATMAIIMVPVVLNLLDFLGKVGAR